MINVKDQFYKAIKDVTENVSDGYPKEWSKLPAIQYMEEDNSVAEFTDGKEQKAHLQYRVDIWDNRSTSLTAMAVDEEVSKLGLKRIQCNDVDDPSGLKHKVMRYEGIIDIDNQIVYNN